MTRVVGWSMAQYCFGCLEIIQSCISAKKLFNSGKMGSLLTPARVVLFFLIKKSLPKLSAKIVFIFS